MKKVAIIGLGYVGLPTLAAIAKTNQYKVVGFDIDAQKISKLNKKIDPIGDPDVEKFLNKKSGNVKFTNKESGLKNSDIFIISVPTPVLTDYTPDYRFVISAAKIVARYLQKNAHVVLESTVNPGTCEEIIQPILEKESSLKAGQDFNIAHCPERINPGDPKWNIYNIPRNIGSINKKSNHQIANFYRSFIQAPINEVENLKIAEATKIVENTFRDINIAYVNELAQSFDAMGIDLFQTIKAASNKPFSFMPHFPGAGVGGHCIAVDPYYLIKRASQNGFNHRFLKLAREINESMPEYTVSKLIRALNDLGKSVKNSKIAMLGLSYKPNVGDIRESPAIKIQTRLTKLGADLTIYDPTIEGYHDQSLENVVKNNLALVIVTAHQEFIDSVVKFLDKSKVRVIVDGRNCLDKNAIEAKNIIYKGIGR